MPLLADYKVVLAEKDVWLAIRSDQHREGVFGVLVLEPRVADLMIESIATDPLVQGQGLGRIMLAAAEAQAKTLHYDTVRLYTGKPLTHLIAWYARHGFTIEREEPLSDRTIVHMMKRLAP